jgi:hypothetical protein
MTPPQPPSQTLSERLASVIEVLDVTMPFSLHSERQRGDRIIATLREVEAALAAQEASPQPDLACVCQCDDGLVREWVMKARDVARSKGYTFTEARQDLARAWFEKGFQAGLMSIDQFGEQHETAEEAYLDACRQEGA